MQKSAGTDFLPKRCSFRKMERVFKASNYIARKPKRLVEDKGILSIPNPQRPPPWIMPIQVYQILQLTMLNNSVTVTGLVGLCQVWHTMSRSLLMARDSLCGYAYCHVHWSSLLRFDATWYTDMLNWVYQCSDFVAWYVSAVIWFNGPRSIMSLFIFCILCGCYIHVNSWYRVREHDVRQSLG